MVSGAMTLLVGPGFVFLLFKLSQVDDAFKVRRENIWMFCGTFVFIGRCENAKMSAFLSTFPRVCIFHKC